MGKLLLDSSALFLYLTQSKRIGKKTIRLLNNSQLYYSPISLIEFKIKELKGKLRIGPLSTDRLGSIGLVSYPLSDAAAERFTPVANDDPFDNILLAQTLDLGGRFLTSDLEILRLNLDYVVDLTD